MEGVELLFCIWRICCHHARETLHLILDMCTQPWSLSCYDASLFMKLFKSYSCSYCSCSHNSPKFSKTSDMDVLLDAGLLAVVFLSFLFSTENRSSTWDVSMVAKLEFSCVITVFAIFSLNFWSLEKKFGTTGQENSLQLIVQAYWRTAT